jgi:hypothetical protein
MEILLGLLSSFSNPKQQRDGALALYTLVKRATALSPIDAAPPPPPPQVHFLYCHLLMYCAFIWMSLLHMCYCMPVLYHGSTEKGSVFIVGNYDHYGKSRF